MLKMSLGNIDLVVILFASCIAGITGTYNGYAEHAACGLADVAHSPFELAISLSSPEWYQDGMEVFAFNGYTHNGYRWDLKNISWGIVRQSTRVDNEIIVKICEKSFAAWSEAVPGVFVFGQALPDTKPDIRISFESNLPPKMLCTIRYPEQSKLLDAEGAEIVINDTKNWIDEEAEDYNENLPYIVIHQLGHILGLGHSLNDRAVMHKCAPRLPECQPPLYSLHSDDRAGLRELYKERLALK